jgi:putative membrane protein
MLQREPGTGQVMSVSAVPLDAKPVDDPRIYLAAERTFLSWIRTSVSLMGFGFVIARFALFMREYGVATGLGATGRPRVSSFVGFGMVCVGVAVAALAAARHRAYVKALQMGVGNPPLDVKTSLAVAGVLALVGLAIAIHIFML